MEVWLVPFYEGSFLSALAEREDYEDMIPGRGGFKPDKKFLGCASEFFYSQEFAQAFSLAHPSDKKIPFFEGSFLSALAEREGFEPSIPCGIHAFQACQFSHSCTSP